MENQRENNQSSEMSGALCTNQQLLNSANSALDAFINHSNVTIDISAGWGPAVKFDISIAKDGYTLFAGYGHGKGFDFSLTENYEFRDLEEQGLVIYTYAAGGDALGGQGGIILIPGKGINGFIGFGFNVGGFAGTVAGYAKHHRW